MKHFFTIITFLTILIAASSEILGAAIPFRYRHFNNFEERTTSMHIRSVIQLPTGMVWMGTTSGLYSFDGYDMRRYDNPEHPTGIVYCLTAASGNIYMGCETGLFALDIKTRKVTPLKKLKGVNTVTKHRDLLWVGTSEGLFSYSPETDTYEPAHTVNQSISSPVMSLCPIDKSIYIGTLTDFGVYDPAHRSFKIINGQMPMVSSIERHPDGKRLWVGTGHTLFQYNPVNEALTAECNVPVVKTMNYDNQGNLLIGSDNGLYMILASGGIAVVTHDARDQNSLSSDVVWDISKDDEGNVWFATDNGLSLSRDEDSFKVFPLPALTSSGQGNQIYTINMDKEGSLWAGGSNGVIRLSGMDGDTPVSRWYQMKDNHSFLPHNRIRKIFIDSQERLWMASDRGMLLYLSDSETFKHFEVKDNSLWIYDICEDSDGNIWIASFSGVHCLGNDIANWGDIISPVASFTSENGLDSNRITSLGFNRQGYLWILSNRFPIKIDTKGKKIEKLTLEKDGERVYPTVMTIDEDGTVWTTDGATLFRLTSSPRGVTSACIPLTSSLSVEALALTDVGKEIWISNSNGIFTVNKKDFTVIHHTASKKFTSMYKASDGKIWLGTDDRIVEILNDKDISSASATPSVTDVKVNGSFPCSDSDIETGRIVLPHNKNTLEISFSDFSFGEVKFSTLMFKLEGAMTDWVKIDAGQNKIFLPSLPPGEYQLYIARAGMTDHAKPALSIVIRQPWYLSTLAKCLYAVAAILVVIWIFYFVMLRQRLASERRERERLVEQGKSKVNFLSNVSHEFKTPLNIVITSLSKLMKSRSDNSDKELLGQAKTNADKINSLLRMMSEVYQENDNFSPLAIPSKIDIIELSTSIFDVCREQFKEKGLDLRLISPAPPLYVNADPFKMESIIGNLLSNACKYTLAGGKVELTISAENSMLKITVSDTGIGIPKSDIPYVFRRYFRSKEAINMGVEGSGIGLSAVKEYVELHRGTVNVESSREGTLFTVLMPVLLDSGTDKPLTPSTEKISVGHKKSIDRHNDLPLVAVIDDNNQTVDFISGLLSDKYRCVTASDGKAGLKLCLDLQPDIIVTDLAMPVMDGLQMCSRLRNHTSMSTVPIIMLTGKNNPSSELKSLKVNIDAFFEKPFDHLLFLAKIEQLLESRQKMKEQARIQSISISSTEKVVSSDEKLLRNVTFLIEQEISNPDFSVGMLSEKSGIGEKQLYRKIKMLTELSPSEYIRSIRLKKAGVLLTRGGFTVSEVMYMVGFSNASYFTRCFKKEFGVTPVEYQSRHRK